MRFAFLATCMLALASLALAAPADAEEGSGTCEAPVDHHCCNFAIPGECIGHCLVYAEEPVVLERHVCADPTLPSGLCHHAPRVCVEVSVPRLLD